MRMAPIPVIRLLSLAGLREFVRFFVIGGEVESPRGVLVIVPVVIVLVGAVVDSDLDPVIVGAREQP